MPRAPLPCVLDFVLVQNLSNVSSSNLFESWLKPRNASFNRCPLSILMRAHPTRIHKSRSSALSGVYNLTSSSAASTSSRTPHGVIGRSSSASVTPPVVVVVPPRFPIDDDAEVLATHSSTSFCLSSLTKSVSTHLFRTLRSSTKSPLSSGIGSSRISPFLNLKTCVTSYGTWSCLREPYSSHAFFCITALSKQSAGVLHIPISRNTSSTSTSAIAFWRT